MIRVYEPIGQIYGVTSNYYDIIFTVFAHEYFHLHHYVWLHKHNSISLDKGINKYNPGTKMMKTFGHMLELKQ